MSGESEIAYQNKDITAKYLEQHLKNKSFAVYGINIPKIVDVLPTNLPIIEANELRLDNLFELEDGSLALVDYESTYADIDKIKYLNYIVRTLKRNMEKHSMLRKIRMIVIYTADIEPARTRPFMDVGCLKFQLQEAFLTELDSEGIRDRLWERVKHREKLTEEEQMQFIILPLTYKGQEKKQACIRECFEMAKEVQDIPVQTFMLSGMLVFADKVIADRDSKEIRRWLEMTKVGRLIEEEKLEYAREQVEKASAEVARSKETEFARILLKRGDDIEEFKGFFTILTDEDMERIKREIE
ncbi:hypothetical protein NE683_11305 [Bariatricus massiliensis]|uniref:Uncharacterized protein n=1 Tax=Bariatricus massiliensis TaxID=1745713 RepID=A0ABS8DGH7_9FIRM|nr:hypothetical protein [Bariatricus massiliensis]MCB7304414.1 hypothetical protein [Bariatricus massiliensis]MCB7375065.1 hypothetical protein [Bariatricus massiliensis]MCB7387524.1 hypothetical protein [Bariatricus massiliensis]MCB7411686.1 hypothetical protein [Bariatricus massiliensis]MCQ5253821.1 hypothetical protein [Bariatricus massiliensis]